MRRKLHVCRNDKSWDWIEITGYTFQDRPVGTVVYFTSNQTCYRWNGKTWEHQHLYRRT